MKKVLIGAGVLLLVIGVVWFVQTKKATDVESKSSAGAKMITIETVHGNIEIELYASDAPKTVARIAELAQEGFYNGLTFHRVVPGFVVQGGDPAGNGTGGSGKKLPAEFTKRKHVEGSVAMARAPGDINSADSQFYISLGQHSHLDGQYTIFGFVTSGMDANQEQPSSR